MAFNNVYRGKKVLITGNTGFKGSWLSAWLLMLGAEVYGYSNSIPTQPSMFEVVGLPDRIHHHYGDIRNKEEMSDYVQAVKPDFIFHLAAQAIVSTSYKEPFDTITTNVVGTASVLEAIRNITWNCTCVLITSDKAYDNVEWIWGYRETDAVGGRMSIPVQRVQPNLLSSVIGNPLSRLCPISNWEWPVPGMLSEVVTGRKTVSS